MGMAVVTLKKGEGRLLKSGGMWIFDNEIDTVMGNFENGDIVLVHDFDGYPMGRGFINTNSKITVRLMTRDENVDIVMLKLGDMILEIFHYQEKEKLPEHSKELAIDLKTIGNKHFGLGVKDIVEAKKFVEENKLSDSEIIINKGRLGKPYFFIKDTDGILMEIIEED